MAKCPKCDNDSFKLEKTESPTKMAIVTCAECNTAITALEDIDIAKWQSDMFRNHQYFENEFRSLKTTVNNLQDKLDKQNGYIIDLLERLHSKR